MSLHTNRLRLVLLLLPLLPVAAAGAVPSGPSGPSSPSDPSGPSGPSGTSGPPALPARDAATGATWWPQVQPRAAVLFVADPRSEDRLPRQAVSLLRELGFSVMLLDPQAMNLRPQQALDRVSKAWAGLARQPTKVPRVLAGHGFGATLATLMTDALDPAQRPQLLWLLAPGRPAPRFWLGGFNAPSDLARPAAALARVEALCIGEIERATRVLMVHGGQDREVPAQVTKAIADAAPEATVLLIKAAGHHDLLEAADSRSVLTRLLNGWLAAQLRAARLRSAPAAAPT